MRLLPICSLLVCLTALGLAQDSSGPVTRAEASKYAETSRHADVLRFLQQLESLRFADRLRVTTMGTSTEGRPLPLVIASRQPHPQDEGGFRDRLRVLVNGNIHAGEVEGKEVILMLLREIARGRHDELLRGAVVLFVPNFNPDGNDRVSPKNRVSQNGPDGGVGQRPNAAGLDLNRDFLKIESPECRALMDAFRRFDPHLFLDLHTTNGSAHGYHLTYAPSLSTNVDPRLDAFMRRSFLPEVGKGMIERFGFRTEHYGNFPRRGDARGWYTYDHRPRFGTNYYGLRNRLGLVSEAYSYLRFEDRVRVTRAFVLENLRAAVHHAAEIRALCRAADAAAAAPAPEAGLSYDTDYAEPVERDILVGKLASRELEGLGTRYMVTGEFEAERMPVRDAFKSARTLPWPAAWAVLEASESVLENLARHGLSLRRLTRAARVTAEAFVPAAIHREERPYQGHRSVRLEGRYERREVDLPAGTLLVPARQRLVRVAAQLLEAVSEDSLTTWNFFDDHVRAQGEGESGYFPVLRLPSVETLRAEPVSSRDR